MEDYKNVRINIRKDIYAKFKHICVDKDLSLPKQTAALIKAFVQLQEDNDKRIKNE